MLIRKMFVAAALGLASSLAAALTPGFAEISALPEGAVLVVPVAEEGALPDALDAQTKASLQAAMTSAKFSGKSGEVLSQFGAGAFERVVLLGLGKEEITARSLQDLGGQAVTQVGLDGGKDVAVLWPGLPTDAAHPAAHIALGLQLGGYRFDKYKSAAEDETPPQANKLTVYSEGASAAQSHWQSEWAPVAEGVFFTRDLISEPANVIYPESFVERTRDAFRGVENVSIDVLDVRDMEKLNMGALLGVGMGSERPPRLLVVNYRGGDKGEAPLAFVGKGVTFDTGGISLKSPKGMWRMKYDMSGAAAVTGTVLALAQREAPVNVVAVAALVENMPSERAQRPGDVRQTMSGKTIEVINTDAEGRLILADAIWYAQEEFEPALVVDVATLTGSVRVALGEIYAGLFSRHDELVEQVLAAGVVSGEEAWRLPLHPKFVEAIGSDIADVKNSVEGGYGGASLGAEFIGSFVKEDTRWVHLDIAGRGWAFEPSATTPKGAAGWGVRLLNQLVLDYYQ